jgi:hypothetical protein
MTISPSVKTLGRHTFPRGQHLVFPVTGSGQAGPPPGQVQTPFRHVCGLVQHTQRSGLPGLTFGFGPQGLRHGSQDGFHRSDGAHWPLGFVRHCASLIGLHVTGEP